MVYAHRFPPIPLFESCQTQLLSTLKHWADGIYKLKGGWQQDMNLAFEVATDFTDIRGEQCKVTDDNSYNQTYVECFTLHPWDAPYRPITDLLIDLPSWCREDTLWSGDHRASSSPCNKV